MSLGGKEHGVKSIFRLRSWSITFAVDALPLVFLHGRDHVRREVEAARMKVLGAFTAGHELFRLVASVLLLSSQTDAAFVPESCKRSD